MDINSNVNIRENLTFYLTECASKNSSELAKQKNKLQELVAQWRNSNSQKHSTNNDSLINKAIKHTFEAIDIAENIDIEIHKKRQSNIRQIATLVAGIALMILAFFPCAFFLTAAVASIFIAGMLMSANSITELISNASNSPEHNKLNYDLCSKQTDIKNALRSIIPSHDRKQRGKKKLRNKAAS